MGLRVLVIQSSSRALEKVQSYVENEYPEAEVDVLTTTRATLRDQHIEVRGEVITLDNELFQWEKLTESERAYLKGKDYDEIFVLFNDIYQGGYSNVISLAQNIQGNSIHGFDYFGRRRPLSGLAGTWFWTKSIFIRAFNRILELLGIICLIAVFIPDMVIRSLWYRISGSGQH